MLKVVPVNNYTVFTAAVIDEDENILFFISVNQDDHLLLWGNDEIGREYYSEVLYTKKDLHNFVSIVNEYAKSVDANKIVISNDYDYYKATTDTQNWTNEGFKHQVGLANHILIRDVQ